MSYTFEKITEVDKDEWMRLFSESYTSMCSGKNIEFPITVANVASRKLGLYKQNVNFLKEPNNFCIRGTDSNSKLVCLLFYTKDKLEDFRYNDIMAYYGKDSGGSRTFVYSDQFSDDLSAFLKSENFSDIRIRVPVDSKVDKSLQLGLFKIYKNYCEQSNYTDLLNRNWRQYDSKLY